MNKKNKKIENPVTLGKKIPQNQEHREALQSDVNKFKEQFIKTLSLENQKKFKAVDKACKILIDAGVIFFLYPHLPYSEDPSKSVSWQWNSASETCLDKNGELNKPLLGEVNCSFVSAVFKTFYGMVQGSNYLETLNNYSSLVAECHAYDCGRLIVKKDSSKE